MGNSLQDQLIKSGLIKKNQVKQIQTEKKRERKNNKINPATVEISTRAAAQQAQIEKNARDRELNHQRQTEIILRAAENELRQLIHQHRIIRNEGTIAYHFTDGNILKHLYVTAEQHAKIINGQFAIVRQDNFYELIPADVAERVRLRDPSLILVLNQTSNKISNEDPYADYPIPDDLIW